MDVSDVVVGKTTAPDVVGKFTAPDVVVAVVVVVVVVVVGDEPHVTLWAQSHERLLTLNLRPRGQTNM